MTHKDKIKPMYYVVESKDSTQLYYLTVVAKTVIQIAPYWIMTDTGTKIEVQGTYIVSIIAYTEDDYLYGRNDYSEPEPLKVNGEVVNRGNFSDATERKIKNTHDLGLKLLNLSKITLKGDEFDKFLEACENPEPPNQALLDAARYVKDNFDGE